MRKVEMTFPRTATLADVKVARKQLGAVRAVLKQWTDEGAVIVFTVREVKE